MRYPSLMLFVGLTCLAAGCASDPDRQWMKIGQTYTVDDFRRDYSECSPRGKLDDACMRSRGWIDVRAAEKPTEPADRSRPGSQKVY